jgi:tetrahydromethanopterin S-methyltransferase subunit G
VDDPSDVEARLAALEARVEEVAADAAAARHLAAAGDRDLADLGVKVDANRRAINALGVQTAARFDRVDERFDRVEQRFDRRLDGVDQRLDGVDQRLDGVDQRFAGVYQRFDRLEHEMRTGFAEMRGKFDQAAAGQQQIVDLITGLIPGQSEE